eukprot:TRINITY_DN18684_c0_g1_i1.p1 TRINITY_DN18684_c0_g1~~TRINITY_DN18684_c0_g1_i1.p1  ORF type:complete len:236 (+),score=40.45 TRINITY_DN18684_c0_g1_i1:67-708(+)
MVKPHAWSTAAAHLKRALSALPAASEGAAATGNRALILLKAPNFRFDPTDSLVEFLSAVSSDLGELHLNAARNMSDTFFEQLVDLYKHSMVVLDLSHVGMRLPACISGFRGVTHLNLSGCQFEPGALHSILRGMTALSVVHVPTCFDDECMRLLVESSRRSLTCIHANALGSATGHSLQFLVQCTRLCAISRALLPETACKHLMLCMPHMVIH